MLTVTHFQPSVPPFIPWKNNNMVDAEISCHVICIQRDAVSWVPTFSPNKWAHTQLQNHFQVFGYFVVRKAFERVERQGNFPPEKLKNEQFLCLAMEICQPIEGKHKSQRMMNEWKSTQFRLGVERRCTGAASKRFLYILYAIIHRHNYDVQEYMDRVESNDAMGIVFPFAFVGGAAWESSRNYSHTGSTVTMTMVVFARISIRCHRSIAKQKDFIPAMQTKHIIVRSLVDDAIRKFVVEIRSRPRSLSLPSLFSVAKQNWLIIGLCFGLSCVDGIFVCVWPSLLVFRRRRLCV